MKTLHFANRRMSNPSRNMPCTVQGFKLFGNRSASENAYPGFTLIEELVALSLSAIVMSMSLMLLTYCMKCYRTYKALCLVQQDCRYAIEQIDYECKSMMLGPDCISGQDHGILTLKDPKDPLRSVSIRCGTIDGRNVLERVVYQRNTSINTRKIIDNAGIIAFDYDTCDNVLNVTLTTQSIKESIEFTIHSKLYSRVGD